MDRKARWQRGEEESAVDEASGSNIVEDEDAAAYEYVLCSGCSDHHGSLSVCFLLCGAAIRLDL